MTVTINTSSGKKFITNVTIVRKPLETEDTNYNYVCFDTSGQKRYINNIEMITG